LGLECAAEDGVSGFLGGRFQHIQGGLSLQSSDIGGREVEGSKFGHVVRGGIINAADQDTNMTHGALLNQCRSSILPQSELVPGWNLTQRLFALTTKVVEVTDLAAMIGARTPPPVILPVAIRGDVNLLRDIDHH